MLERGSNYWKNNPSKFSGGGDGEDFGKGETSPESALLNIAPIKNYPVSGLSRGFKNPLIKKT